MVCDAEDVTDENKYRTQSLSPQKKKMRGIPLVFPFHICIIRPNNFPFYVTIVSASVQPFLLG